MQELLLRQLGEWLKVNGEGIYGSKHWTHQNDTLTPGVWFTSQPKQPDSPVYAIVLNWPEKDNLHLGSVKLSEGATIEMLGVKGHLKWKSVEQGVEIELPKMTPQLTTATPALKWSWMLKIINH
jgi:alpha-L-fucosidase